MPKHDANNIGLLPGKLEMLILNMLSLSPQRGYGMAQHIRKVSRDVRQVGEGALYSALQRLLIDG